MPPWRSWHFACYIYPEDCGDTLRLILSGDNRSTHQTNTQQAGNVQKAGQVRSRAEDIQHYIYTTERDQGSNTDRFLERNTSRLNFASTNNKAEYEALLVGLRIAEKMKVKVLKVKVDSKLVACQLKGEFVASSEGMARYLAKAKELTTLFSKFSIENIPRNQNQKADVLSKLASVAFNHLTKELLVEVLNKKSVEAKEISAIVEEEEDNWMTPIVKCLKEGVWLKDENEARALRMKISELHNKRSARRGVWDSFGSMISGGKDHATRWGLDILGPLLEGPGKLKFIIVAIDYFTKWMEAKPLAKTTAQNEEEIRLNLDLIQERRETATIREAKYKKKVEQYYNKRVQPMSFKVGDFMYRRNEASRVENQGKLGSNWEGPYRVIEAYDNGSYKLCNMNDREVPRTWHAINLQNYFM
ncbi:reverse transcriptase domain-containing protein [Tanacetum coccineum]